MKVSVNWLSKLVDLKGITPDMLGDGLTNAGLEVEAIDPVAIAPDCVVGYVESCIDHPDSDHLHVCQVNVGKEILQIVCGAPNVAAGQKVIVALDGAKLVKGTIKRSTIRGMESNGMICSLLELNVSDKFLSEQQKNGIEILPEDAVLGTDPLPLLGLDDVVLDIKQTPNRSDFLAMFSIAKEVSAIFDRPCTLPVLTGNLHTSIAPTLQVHSQTINNPLFMGKVIEQITIKPSPLWMVQALNSSGVKSINNVVDISNVVMLETGQPLHFYDIDSLPVREITVKSGFNQEVVALDQESYHLEEDDVIITSQGKPIGIGGIMGLGDSMIKPSTKGLIIEVASFDQIAVRKTAKRLGLATESSLRYSKPLDPLAPLKAMERAVQLLIEYADARGIEDVVQAKEIQYTPTEVMVTQQKINDVLGINLSSQMIYDVFKRLDFAPVVKEEDVFFTTIPSYRQDIFIAEDLIEEVIRLVGYDAIESTLPQMPQTIGQLSETQRNVRLIESTLLGLGLNQVVTYTLVSKEKTEGKNGLLNPYQLLSPLSEERAVVRNQLIHSELEMLAYNQANKNTEGYYFEQSIVYGESVNDHRLALIGSGGLMHKNWQGVQIGSDFYVLKGIVETLLKKLGYSEGRIRIEPMGDDQPMFHPSRSAQLLIDKECIGYFGQIHPAVAKRYKLKETQYGEISLTRLFAHQPASTSVKSIIRFPVVKRDLALLVANDIPASSLIQAIKQAGKPYLKEVEVFDVFMSESLGFGVKSLALSLSFVSDAKTLSEDEINTAIQKIMEKLKANYQAVLRD